MTDYPLPNNSTDLSGRVALVTGASSGFGARFARVLASQGAAVAIAARRIDRLEALAAEIEVAGGRALPVAMDATDADALVAAVDAAEAAFGPVDILVNNAGMQFVSPVEDFPVDKWNAIIGLNLTAAFHTTRLAVPGMKAKGWGRIINTASAHSLTASPFKSAYNASKHGIAGFTKTIALELAQTGVTANCISPGYVWTPLIEGQIPDTMKARGLTREQVINDVLLAKQPTKKFVQPEEVGALAAFLCRPEAGNVTGANWSIDGGWTAE